jgi:hypothetical protein
MKYILLDAECMEYTMQNARELNPTHQSLYRTREGAEEVSPDEAPYLFTWPHSEAFSNFILQEGWGQSWGILINSSADYKTIYQHLRRFLTVQLEGGAQVRFRFYDPRVLRLFLPSCTTEQLREFFGPVDSFLVEDEDPALALDFRHESGILKQERLRLEDILHKSAASMSGELQGSSTSLHIVG